MTAAARPWHEMAGRSPEAQAAALAALRAEYAALTNRERNQALWSEAYGRARDAGFDPERAASLATMEVRTAPRASADVAAARQPAPERGGKFTLADMGDRIGWVSETDLEPGRVVAWHDPDGERGPGLFAPEHEAVSTSRAGRVEQGEFEYAEDCTEETGAAVSPAQFEKMRRNRSKLVAMTEQIAERLRELGVESKRPDGVKVWAYWLHSGHLEELPAYRRICILPSVAASMRAPKLAALEYWLDRHPHARFWTFTTGARCALTGRDGLEERLGWLSRKLSKLAHALRAFGVEIVFRSVEFGGLEKKTHAASERREGGGLEWDAEGSPLFHPHAHCVVNAKFGFNPRRWEAACQFARDFWKRGGKRLHCDFGEIIGDARECCKYVTKPGDLLKLSGPDLAQLFEITYRAKLCHPMGSLAREIRVREGFTVQIERAGVVGEARAVRDEAMDEASAVPDCAFVGLRQARTLRQLAVKHGVEVATLAEQNPDLWASLIVASGEAEGDPADARLDYGTRIVIFPGGRCLRRVRQGRRMVWVERWDHNKTAHETPSERSAREGLEDAYAATAECARLAAYEGTSGVPPWLPTDDPALIGPHRDFIGAPQLSPAWAAGAERSTRSTRTGSPARVMARLMPAAGPTRVKEPRVIVLSLDGRRPDLTHVRAHPLVIGLWQDTVEAWHAGQAIVRADAAECRSLGGSGSDPYRVHTGTPTVHDPADDAPPDLAEAYFEAERAAFEANTAFAKGINF